MSAQIPDKIMFNTKGFVELYSNPLELYWSTGHKKRPEFSANDKCRRGYVSYWVINNNQLFLKAVEGEFMKRVFIFGHRLAKYTIQNLFPKSKDKLVKATWFSGKLRIPQGKMTMYEDQGYDSRFEKELIVTVDKGNLLKVVKLDYTKHSFQVVSEPAAQQA